MATVSEISELDSGVASPETTPEGQGPLKKSPSPSISSASESKPTPSLSKSNSKEENPIEKGLALLANIDKEDKMAAMLAPSTLIDAEEEEEENVEESIAERLWGLAEMFPSSVRSTSSSVTQKSISFIKASYLLSRQIVWIAVSSSLLLVAPVMFEVERFNVEEMVKQDRNRLVLGPGSAMSGPPPGPGMAPAPSR